MPSPEMFTARDGRSFPLVPVPCCHYCSIPLGDSFGRWNICWRCNTRFRELARANPDEIRQSPYSFTRAVAAGLYITDYPEKGSAGRLIKELKTGGGHSTVLAEAIAHVLRTRCHGHSWDIIVPVPASSRKPPAPTEMLALELGTLINMRVAPVLELDSSYESGQGMPEARKFDNMKGNVRITEAGDVRGRRIMLVDDIMTTRGAAHWCSTVLLEAGATEVMVAVAGRSVDLRHLEFIGYSGPF